MAEMEETFETTLIQTKNEARHRVQEIKAELEQLRRAARGDACGWEETDKGTFINRETGERGNTQIPEALAFARAVQRVDHLGKQEETTKAAQNLAKGAERKRRELDVRLNEARADARAQRELLASWAGSSRQIATLFSSYESKLESTYSILHARHDMLTGKNESLQRSTSKVYHAACSIQKLRDELVSAKIYRANLESKILAMEASFGNIQQELHGLRASLTNAVEAEVKPMRREISKARDALSRERLARTVERRQIAAAWPPGYLAPVALRRHLQVRDRSRQKLFNTACSAIADAEIKREIRRCVANASRWTQTTDDYGRKYFVHADTGEAAWEAPHEML
mmetsp:Transcript_4724/g.15045  ORF Transcript_4724/g.15045 Transcript_4724/m.15045 type:complete len:342 (+) Transcript_4724:248-1273(+)